MNLLAATKFLQFPGGAKFSIGFLAIFHTAVGSLAIGFAFVVTILQIIGYVRKDNQYDLLAKFHLGTDDDTGHFVTETLQKIDGIADTFTIVTFKAF